MKITRDDFLLALNDIRPAFGTDEEDLSQQAQHGIIQFNQTISILKKVNQLLMLLDQVKLNI